MAEQKNFNMLHFSQWKTWLISIICLMSLLFALPNLLASNSWLAKHLPSDKINLGLDLRGGSYLLLDVEFDSYLKEQIGNLVDEVRIALRKERIGYVRLRAGGDKVRFTLRNNDDSGRVKGLVRDISRDLEIKEQDGEVFVFYREDALNQMQTRVIEQSLEIIRRRVDETGTKEPVIQRHGESAILLQVPGLDDPESLKKIIGKTAKLTFHLMSKTNPFPGSVMAVAPDERVLPGDVSEDISGNRRYSIKRKPIITGDMLVDAGATFDQQSNLPVVSFRFNSQGARKFGEVTKNNVGRPFAIVLDEKVISAPVIREPILGGSGIISGNFTVTSANNLAILLRAGALPAPIKIIEERTVGASLGEDSLQAGKVAVVIGGALVLIFMIITYGLFGFFANAALFINIVIIFAVLSLLQATLTLPGIAGIVLTIGMAVDANVLIFERIREEIRVGKSPFAAIDQGFKSAFNTIFDSNITTLIVALVLFLFGSGPIKGFAVTLSIGILSSMFTAIMVTRLMVVTWLRSTKPKVIPI